VGRWLIPSGLFHALRLLVDSLVKFELRRPSRRAHQGNHQSKKEAGKSPASNALLFTCLGFEYSHDLKRSWVYDDDLVADQEELVAAPFRINRYDI
jgi:hypothetical protein